MRTTRAAINGGVPSDRRGTTVETGRRRRRRDDSGDTLAFLVLWPALIVAVLLLLVHTFIVTNAQVEADAAASAGLRAAWGVSARRDFLESYEPHPLDPNRQVYVDYRDAAPHESVREMASAAEDAVAQAAAGESGWRWWTPSAAEVQSDWCSDVIWTNQNLPRPDGSRPVRGESGWVRVVVSGEVVGPLAVLWPDRLETVYAVAAGPAVVTAYNTPDGTARRLTVPAGMPTC